MQAGALSGRGGSLWAVGGGRYHMSSRLGTAASAVHPIGLLGDSCLFLIHVETQQREYGHQRTEHEHMFARERNFESDGAVF